MKNVNVVDRHLWNRLSNRNRRSRLLSASNLPFILDLKTKFISARLKSLLIAEEPVYLQKEQMMIRAYFAMVCFISFPSHHLFGPHRWMALSLAWFKSPYCENLTTDIDRLGHLPFDLPVWCHNSMSPRDNAVSLCLCCPKVHTILSELTAFANVSEQKKKLLNSDHHLMVSVCDRLS